MGFTALTLSAGSAAVSGIGQYYAASGQRMALKTQAQIAEINARASELQVRDAMMQGEQAQQAIRQRASQIKSAQRVALGANAIDLSSDTAVALQTSTDCLAEQDVQTAQLNALKSAWGYRTQAQEQRTEAMMARAQRKGISPLLAGATSLLTGAAQTGLMYADLKQSGALPPDKAPKWWPM